MYQLFCATWFAFQVLRSRFMMCIDTCLQLHRWFWSVPLCLMKFWRWPTNSWQTPFVSWWNGEWVSLERTGALWVAPALSSSVVTDVNVQSLSHVCSHHCSLSECLQISSCPVFQLTLSLSSSVCCCSAWLPPAPSSSPWIAVLYAGSPSFTLTQFLCSSRGSL